MKRAGLLVLTVVMAACGGPTTSESIEKLITRRDSLQQVQYQLDKELNAIDQQIALLDTSASKEDVKLQKLITMQKDRMAKMELKVRQLENKLSKPEEDNLTPVAVKEMKGETFKHYITVYGEVEADKYAMISPEMGGRIQGIPVNEGQRVGKGELLVSLNTEAIQKQIEGLESSLEFAVSTFEKQDVLWKQGIGSEMQYLQAKNTKENLEAQLESLKAQKQMAQIRAPFDGVVDKIFLKVGELASPGFPVVEFVNLSRITIKADVPEKFIDEVKTGQEVELTFAALPGMILTAPIKNVAKVINSASRTFQIELSVNNAGERIKPNMVSSIRINDFTRESAFVVPSLVIRKDISGEFLYLVKEQEGKSIISKQYVKPGKANNDQSLILEGLQEGDQVVVEGFHLVSTGLPVKVVE